MKIFSQNEEEAKKLKEYNFKDIEVLKEEGNLFNNITLFKTKGQHGSETVIDMFRKRNLPTDVCGVVFNHKYEKSLYIAGDTILCNEVKKAIDKYKPRIIVINAGHAQYVGNNPLIMGKEDFYETTKISPNSIFIATHMEAVNHAMLSRNELREYAKEKEFSSKLLIPQDGEVCDL